VIRGRGGTWGTLAEVAYLENLEEHGPGRPLRRLRCSIQPARLIGRDAELAEVAGLLADPAVRLVTLTGRSGVGKTRLALEAARAVDAAQPGAVWVVSLASVQDPELVLAEVAAQLELTSGPGVSVANALVRWLRRSARMLLLDNFEHLLGAAGLLPDLLTACQDLTLLVTSQAPLRLAAEQVVHLQPLTLPEPTRPSRPQSRHSRP
jgi:predicted ATPase